jgi:hypothetical protein
MYEVHHDTRTGRMRGRQRKADVRPQADAALGHCKQGALRDHAHLRCRPIAALLQPKKHMQRLLLLSMCWLVGLANIEAYMGAAKQAALYRNGPATLPAL